MRNANSYPYQTLVRGVRCLLPGVLGVALLLLPTHAKALEAIDTLGDVGAAGSLAGEYRAPTGIEVNDSGAGPAEPGTIYVADSENHRIQRYVRDDAGTPANLGDDTYIFVAAWGAGVDRESGGDEYEICTIPEQCKAGIADDINGALSSPSGIAVDQDTGQVHVVDAGNHRINVYAGDGEFIRSFGHDVVKSGPGLVPADDEVQRLTVAATSSKFALQFRGASTSTVGTASRGIVGTTTLTPITATQGNWEVGQFVSGAGIQPGTTITAIGSNSLTISKPTTQSSSPDTPLYGNNFSHDAPAAELEAALNDLPTIGGIGGSVSVNGGPGDETGSTPYEIEFGGELAEDSMPELVVRSGLMNGAGAGTAQLNELVAGGAFDICEAADGDVCQAGAGQVGEGDMADARDIDISPGDGDSGSGTVFVSDAGNRRVNTYDVDGSSPGTIGSSADFIAESPSKLAVDSRGILYVENKLTDQGFAPSIVERYDTENANGAGVGFLNPIPHGVSEQQQIRISATAGTFRVHFDGESSGDIPFNATQKQFAEALADLPSLGINAFQCCNNLGGPGDGGGTKPYRIAFRGRLGATDVPEITVSDGSVPLSGGDGASVQTTTGGEAGLIPSSGNRYMSLQVDPDDDGTGPDVDTLYYGSQDGVIQQFGPNQPPGGLAAPSTDEDRHGGRGVIRDANDIAIEPTAGIMYQIGREFAPVASTFLETGPYVLGELGPAPTAVIDGLSSVTSDSVVVEATIDPNGPPSTRYHLEYRIDGDEWIETPEEILGQQDNLQQVDIVLEPTYGLEPNTDYEVRLVAGRRFDTQIVTSAEQFTTLGAPPVIETTGSPTRTTTTVQFLGRVNPRNSETAYRFEYGPTAAYGQSTAPVSVGSGARTQLVAADVEGLEPDTTYHYRLVADNGNGPGVEGEDMTVTTRAGEELANQSDEFPGPPASDRAWELVSLADPGGVPVANVQGVSATGDRAVYILPGGTSDTEYGSLVSLFFSERGSGGWQAKAITPPRSEVPGARWFIGDMNDDLSQILAMNTDIGTTPSEYWKLGATKAPAPLLQPSLKPEATQGKFGAISADGSVAIAAAQGSGLDPSFPSASSMPNLYEVSASPPKLVSVMPDGTAAGCGARLDSNTSGLPLPRSKWLSADGELVFFHSRGDDCGSPTQIYLRDRQAGTTKLISGDLISGEPSRAAFLKQTPGAAFFWSAARLDSDDVHVSGSSDGGDVYRYEIASGELDCVSCVADGIPAALAMPSDSSNSLYAGIAVSDDGSRVYFHSTRRLSADAPAGGGTYRVKVTNGDLAYVGNFALGGELPYGDGSAEARASAISPNGAVLVVRATGDWLNPVGGADNDGTLQLYRYDDRDRSLVCISCPADGSAPRAQIGSAGLSADSGFSVHEMSPLSADGMTIAFATSTALGEGDVNTAPGVSDPRTGTDIYEWRDGRQVLVSDGERSWPIGTFGAAIPGALGVSSSGDDVFFTAPARYTPDAADSFTRIYTARIGGGFEFPDPPAPCALENCQGPSSPIPADPGSTSASGQGPANQGRDQSPKVEPPKKCKKGKKLKRGKCVKKGKKKPSKGKKNKAGKKKKAGKGKGNKRKASKKGGRR